METLKLGTELDRTESVKEQPQVYQRTKQEKHEQNFVKY